MLRKAQKCHGLRSGHYGGYSNGVPLIHFFQVEHRIKFMTKRIKNIEELNDEL
jgi:hypothetical protein